MCVVLPGSLDVTKIICFALWQDTNASQFFICMKAGCSKCSETFSWICSMQHCRRAPTWTASTACSVGSLMEWILQGPSSRSNCYAQLHNTYKTLHDFVACHIAVICGLPACRRIESCGQENGVPSVAAVVDDCGDPMLHCWRCQVVVCEQQRMHSYIKERWGGVMI